MDYMDAVVVAISFAFALVAALTAQTALLMRLIDRRFADFGATMDAKFTTVDHRLTAIESDMHLVKQHLLGTPAV